MHRRLPIITAWIETVFCAYRLSPKSPPTDYLPKKVATGTIPGIWSFCNPIATPNSVRETVKVIKEKSHYKPPACLSSYRSFSTGLYVRFPLCVCRIIASRKYVVEISGTKRMRFSRSSDTQPLSSARTQLHSVKKLQQQ